MPKYLSTDQLINTYGELAFYVNSDHNEDGVSDQNAADSAIRWAEGVADSYLGKRYELPLPGITSNDDVSVNDVPEALRGYIADIVVYRLAGVGHDVVTKEKRLRYEDAIAWFEKIACGKADLGLAEQPATRNGAAFIMGPERELTREDTDGVY